MPYDKIYCWLEGPYRRHIWVRKIGTFQPYLKYPGIKSNQCMGCTYSLYVSLASIGAHGEDCIQIWISGICPWGSHRNY
uniref:Uncharacterized protein n=1 Tax=Pyxicephalus adspersus TaxID=30357 RepID=A0AAV2ZXW3_PYXAD|nr:TPA: hypothetical protein GDO54_004121 [Pyxicephalus adspersus]